MPHRCASCRRTYDNYSTEIIHGCICGSKMFVYLKKLPDGPVVRPKAVKEGHAPGPAAYERINIEKEVKKAIKLIDKPRKRKPKMEFDMDTIKILEDGVYEININRLLNNEPLVIEVKEDGKYLIHLASVFQDKIENLEKDLETRKQPSKRKSPAKKKVPSKKQTTKKR